MKSRFVGIFVLVAGLTAGCKATTIGRAGKGSPPATVVPYEAETRAVLARQTPSGVKLCVEPPPMTARDINLNVDGKVKAKDIAEVSGTVARETSSQQLYKLDSNNLLLQYALYRLCELGLNGNENNLFLREEYSKIVSKVIEITVANQEAVQALAVANAAKDLVKKREAAIKKLDKALAVEKTRNEGLLREVDRVEALLKASGKRNAELQISLEALKSQLSKGAVAIGEAEKELKKSDDAAKNAEMEFDRQVKAAKTAGEASPASSGT